MTCKYAELLSGSLIGDDASLSSRAMRARLRDEVGQTVSPTTIQAHRSRLCACYSITENAAPGPTDEGIKSKPKVDLPAPGLDYDENGGTLVTAPKPAGEVTPGEAEIFAEYDLDPAHWQIMSIGKSKRQANSGEWFESYRASFKPRKAYEGYGMTPEEIEGILAKRIGGPSVTLRMDEGAAFLAPAGDLQVGKIDGTGTRGILDRFAELTAQVRDDYLARRDVEGLSTVVAPWLGDCIEGLTSQGGKLATRQDLWVTEEVRLIQRLIMLQVEAFAPLAERLIVPVIPGNHDENTRFVSTGGTDSWAVQAGSSVWDTIQKIEQYAPGTFSNVEFVFPQRGELTVTLDVCGSRVVCLHGHQFRGGVAGAEKWLSGHALGRLAPGDADVLLTAHLHHYHAKEVGQGQLICQIPALDGGSDWFRQRTGAADPSGLVSLVTKDGAWNRITRYTTEEDRSV